MLDPKLKQALAMVQKPGRYTGGEPGCVYKDKEKVDLRFAFCFPDTYEVGMSFLGEKILYELINAHPNWWMERAFMPWLDMKEQMEQLGIPLYTLESKDLLTAFDIVGFTLQYEMSFTNIHAGFGGDSFLCQGPGRGVAFDHCRRPLCLQRGTGGSLL